jgi:hypothetical protein
LIARRFVAVNFVYCRMDTSVPLMEHESAIPKAVLGNAKLKEAAYLNVARIIEITLHQVMVNLLYQRLLGS